ncbi:hypothetical protein [Fontivita pretiosa]|uniref:hypothetical protein n=1 Tax=Fontivita pretiosa TaxID=2989684 RepID=UPI003D1814BC
MSRATETTSGVPVSADNGGARDQHQQRDAAREQLRQMLVGRHVCPYCGHQYAGGPEPCPHCTMEDTPATRQATKARIGPWYVLQSRNPAAPGMKYATLLALIHKGQVTARSVIRGPTTHQLWRFAAHVRGVSREFGLCYSCSGSIERTASICPYCQRSQQPPPDPDVLLESRAAPAGAGAGGVEPADNPASHAARVREFNRKRAELSAASASAAGKPRGEPVWRSADGRVVSAFELAHALQDGGSSPDTLASPRRWLLKTLVALVLLLAAAGAGIWYFMPQYRQPAIQWTQQAWATIQARWNAIDWPTWSSSPPAPTNRPAKARPQSPIAPSETVTPSSGQSSLLSEPPAVVRQSPQTPAQTTPEHASAAPSGQSAPPQQNPSPQPTLKPEPRPQAAPPAVQTADAIGEARRLYNQALDAEGRGDYASAVRCYEQIKQLPRSVWQADLQLRLDLAKRNLQNSTNAAAR